MITVLMASISFYMFQYFNEKNLIQNTEFSLQLVADSIAADMTELTYLSKWCGSNKTISDYLEYPDKDNHLTHLSLEAYDRLKEEYQNSKISEYIKRIMICNNRNDYIQVIGKAHDFYNSDPEGIRKLTFFDKLMQSDKVKWAGIVNDPMARTKPEQVIPVIRPVYNSYRASVIGFAYITVSADVITDHFKNYAIPDDSNLIITIDELSYLMKEGTLTPVKKEEQVIKTIDHVAVNDKTSVEVVKYPDGSTHTVITYTSGLKGWSISQSLSKEQFSKQRQWYYYLILFSCFIILSIGTLLTLYLNHMINVPIKKIRKKMKGISAGDFSLDPSIEWDNELGEIGKGINILSGDIVHLMDKRISDEKQKNELEYQILLNQINPHFLYNTLNSIKWMATIQNATGIAEMVTALARLLKKVAKGAEQLITIREELSVLNDYFLIQKYRYGGTLTMELKVGAEDLYDCIIPRFSLQPLVENAIFHGIEPKGGPGFIQIIVRKPDEVTIEVEVIDDGVGMTAELVHKTLTGQSEGSSSFFRKIGISNVNNRMKHTFGNDYGLSIHSESGKGTTMTIRIPYIKKNNDLI
jgi:two-component system sensor histidine kinase YesM